MAKKKAETKKSKRKAGGSKARKGSGKFLLVPVILMSAIFLSTTFLLLIGMLPTIVAYFVDPSRKKTRSVTIGAVNLAGCTPFLLDLWFNGGSFDRSINIISDPMAIVIMYSAAAAGYLIEWALSSTVSGFLYQKGIARTKTIEKEKQALIDRWGEEVSGNMKLDEYGFPLVDGANVVKDTDE